MKRNLLIIAGLLGFAQMGNAQCNPVFTTTPGTITQSSDPGLCTGNVTYSLPTYSGCAGSLVQTAGLASGSDFPTGSTLNTYEVYEVNYLFQEDFSDNLAGWTLDTEWEIGPAVVPFCAGGPGWEDPATDNSPSADNGIAGVVIGGCASTTIHPFYYLTSPVVNTTGATSLYLDFFRWLTSDYTPYMQNTVEVWDGAAWVTIWATGGFPGVTDMSWNLQTFDISAYANANLQVRFGFNINSGGVYTIGQWNLDDVSIYESGVATGVTASFVVNVIPEAPVFNCTSDLSVFNTPNPTCGEIVNYMAPTAFSCLTETTSLTAGFPVGGEFPVGTTLVTYESVQAPATFQFFHEDFSNNLAGWTLDTEWEIGQAVAPFCAGGPGWEDPSIDNSASSDNGIAGVVIGGCASTTIHPFYYLTSPVVNTTGATSVYLDYVRWLTSDYTPFMQNVVEVYDGATWQTVWSTGGSSTNDASWVPESFDISAYSNTNLQVRFGFNVNSNGAYTIGQWNLDDVIISGEIVQTSTCSFNVTVDPLVSTESAEMCPGDSYVFGTQTLTSGGVYYETYTAAAGCDSIVELTLSEIPVYNELANAMICPGDTYIFGTQTLTAGGTYVEVFTSVLGCDSTVTLTLGEFVPPTITVASTDDEINGNDGAINITIGGGSPFYSFVWSNFEITEDISGLAGGDYTVTVTDDVTGCTATETITVNSQVGITEISKDAFTVHPNPSNGIFFVTVDEMESNMRLEILSATGQVVFNKSIVSESTSVDIKNVLPGTYFVRVISDNGMAVESIVIE